MDLLDVSTDMEGVCNDFFHTVRLNIGDTSTVLTKVNVAPSQIRELDPTGAQVIRKGTRFTWSKSRSALPVVGSVLVDSEGTYWTVWKVDNQWHVETYKAFCLNLNIVTATTNQATVLKASYHHGRAGEAKPIWKGLWSGVVGGDSTDVVPARFQPSEETARLEFGAEWTEETYRVYFEPPGVPIEVAGGEYRLVDSDKNRYRVARYFQEKRIDRLPIAVAVRITEGAEYVP